MSATFEFTVLCKKIIPIDVICNKLFQEKSKIIIDSIEIIDNWEYENQITLDMNIDMETLINYVENNKIVMINGLLNDNHRCGLFIEKVSNNITSLDIWISSKNLHFLDEDYITTENFSIYESITDSVLQMNDEYDVYLCGIGVETCFVYNESIDCIIRESANVNRWIIPFNQQFQKIDGFDMVKKKGFAIASRI